MACEPFLLARVRQISAGQQWRFAAIPDSSIFGLTANEVQDRDSFRNGFAAGLLNKTVAFVALLIAGS